MIVETRIHPGEPLIAALSRVAERQGVDPALLRSYRVLRRAIDARGRGGVRVFYRVELILAPGDAPPRELRPERPPVGDRPSARGPSGVRPVVVGSGPAGVFAALRLLEAGVRPILLEQGKAVEARAQDVRRLRAHGVLDPLSNIAFGEGGAGTFSDGKLRTRKRDPRVADVLATFVHLGAPYPILYEAHPHLGTDTLIRLTRALRARLLAREVDLRFEVRVEDLLVREGRVAGVRTVDGQEILADGVILAPGNSARPLLRRLDALGVPMEARASAVGFRIEHPRAWIDRRQYGEAALKMGMAGAEYALTARAGERGIYTFCMCPGGRVVPSQVDPGTVRVNGMSNSRRRAPFSNSGLVVTVGPEDYRLPGTAPEAARPLDGLRWLEHIERRAAAMAGYDGKAPAQRVPDFLARRASPALPPSSFRPGLTAAPLHALLPRPLSDAVDGALRTWERRMPGFAGRDALLIAPETGTSTPLKIIRARDGQVPGFAGLFPAGEGAGAAGGIMSSAIDGLEAAEAWLASAGGSP
jgi:uncharacterized protein